MDVLRISGGHRFRLRHGPSPEIHQLQQPATVAFSPRGLSFLKPRILVKEGDAVLLGQPLVEHKGDPRIRFTSPASGLVQEIRYGPRRSLLAIVIALDEGRESSPQAETYSLDEIDELDRSGVERFLLEAGLWGYLDSFPKRGYVPLSGDAGGGGIAAVHINLVRTESFWPDTDLVIRDRLDELSFGIKALSKLAEKTRLYLPKGGRAAMGLGKLIEVIEVDNIYPSDNIGVQAFYAGHKRSQGLIVGADAELVLDIGHLLLRGKKRTDRLYSLAGDAVKKPRHHIGRLGMAVGDVTDGALSATEDVRLIAGGLFTGRRVRFQDYLGPGDTAIQAMTEDKKRIPFVFFRLGADRYTASRAWLSGFKAGEHEATTSNNGEERACVQCGYCIDICPVELMPNLIMKASVTKDIEKMEWLSIDDCVDCGLCTFVCPSKIELGQEIEAGKKLIEKEG